MYTKTFITTIVIEHGEICKGRYTLILTKIYFYIARQCVHENIVEAIKVICG